MKINFRKAVLTDANSMINVQNLSFYEDFVKYGECPSYNESHEAIEKYIREAIVYIIENGDRVIGDVIICKKSEERYYLRVICIIPEFHNKGIGQKVIKFIEKENSKVKIWELITPFKSFRNHHFYEKMGYRKVNEYEHSDILTMFRYRKEIK